MVARGETASPVPSPLIHNVIRTWTTDQGLPSNFIASIDQTPDGFLWIGTYGGLVRFDGLHFRSFERSDFSELGLPVAGLVVDRVGDLWIGTQRGLFRYRGRQFQRVTLNCGASQGVLGMARSEKSAGAWVLTGDAIYGPDSKGPACVIHSPAAHSILAMAEADDGTLLTADGSAVSFWEGGHITANFALPKVNQLYRTSWGVLAGDGHHLFRLHGRSFEALPREGTEEVVHVMMDHRGYLWMASGGLQGISRNANGKVEMLSMRDGLASNDVRTLFEDRDGNIWVGTISGLQRVSEGRFIAFTERDGLPGKLAQYDAVFEDRKGSIWAGTLESGIAHYDGTRWIQEGRAAGVRAGQVRGFAEDARQMYVALSDYGLFARKQGVFRALDGIPKEYISSPVVTRDGALWFSVLHRGVMRIANGVRTQYGKESGLSDDVVWSLAEDERGTLWAGTRSGAFRWDGARWKLLEGVHASVNAVIAAREGGLYLATASGIHYRGQRAGWQLTRDTGLPSDLILSVAETASGDLWAASARGIFEIPQAQLAALHAGAARRANPVMFTTDDGLLTNAILPIAKVCAEQGRDGRLWFATAAGPVVTSDARWNESAPRASLDDALVDEQIISLANLDIKPGKHRLVFRLTAPAFLAPELIRFRWRLMGWDTRWIGGDASREAVYSGLPPGEYSFVVQAIGRGGEPGPVSAPVPVRLRPFFWQTRWFLALVLLFFAGTVAEITRRRTRRRVERETFRFQERSAERERIASQIHDTFLQDLTGTALHLELLTMQLDEDADAARPMLLELRQRVRETIARSRDMVSNLHAMAGPEEDLAQMLRRVEGEFRVGREPRFAMDVQGGTGPLHPIMRDEMYRACREAVANAFRHSGATEVKVLIESSANSVVMTVCDDGKGMDQNTLEHGRPGHFGIAGMRVHAESLGGSIRIRSGVGEGTEVRFEFPRGHRRAWRLLSQLRAVWRPGKSQA